MPFIARWPGKIAAGQVDDQSLISAVDLLPTFCELARVRLPTSYTPDGVSQVAALMGQSTATREKPLFWKMVSRWPPSNTRPHHWVSYAVVERSWKLVSNRDGSYVELFDIASDPYEKEDRKDREPKIVQQLLERIDAWKATLPAQPTGEVFSAERGRRTAK